MAAKACSRRTVLRGAAAATALAAAPRVSRAARSSSGELRVLHWADQLKEPVQRTFTERTGIKIKATAFSTDQEQVDKFEAAKGEGFDLCQPALDRASQWRDAELLAPFDLSRVPNSRNLIPSLLAVSTELWQWDGKPYHLPHCWGSEAIGWRTDRSMQEYGTLSYGTLWDERYKDAVLGRPHSLLFGIGLWMDASGQLPSNRMLDAYKDEDRFKEIYDQSIAFAIAHKSSIKQFWDTPSSIKDGFADQGCAIGQTLDGPVLELQKEGKPVGFMAPREGAIAWTDGWTMTAAAKNTDQAHAFLDFLLSPEGNAAVAATSGYNPAVSDAAALLPESAKTAFAAAYPGDALEKLWFRRPEPSWFKSLRVQYAERLRTA